MFAGAVVLYLFNPAEHSFYPFCVLYWSTGLRCAGCGSLRALYSLLHGDLAAAFGFNPLLIISLPLWMCLAGRAALRSLGVSLKPLRIRGWWLFAGLGILVVYTVLRNV